MKLGIFLSPGDSLEKQQASGQFDRLSCYYLKAYSKSFDQIFIFSYGDLGGNFELPNKVILIPKPKFIPNYLYQLILPFIHSKIIKTINVFRVFQAPGGVPAIISRIFYKKPYIVSNNYDYVRFALIEKKPLLACLLKIILPIILHFSTKIITPNNIPNGVDTTVFKPNKKLRQPWLILAIARLVRQKNFEVLIQTVAKSQYRQKINLVIIGSGPKQRSLEQLADSLKVKLKIIPNLDYRQLINWYQKAAVFALTSSIEGQPKVLLEAMSCGCACLTSRFPGNIIKDRVSGLVGKDILELSAKLDQLLKDNQLNLRLGQAARRTIIDHFDLNKLLMKEVALLKL